MNVSCDVIRDILPLYAEDMVSDDTRALVEEHLPECEGCTRELENLRKVEKLPLETDVSSLKRVGDTIRRKRILSVMAVFLFVATVLIGSALMLDAKIYLTAEQAIESVEALEDGTIRIHTTNLVVETGSCTGLGEDESLEENFGVVYSTRLSKLLFPTERTPYEELPEEMKELIKKENWGSHRYQWEGGASSYNFWYINAKTGMVDTLLWDAGHPTPQVQFKYVNYHLAYYVLLLAVLCIGCILIEKRFADRWFGKITERFAVIFGCIAVSVVIVTAGQFMELWGEFSEAFKESIIVAIPMSLCVLCIRQLIQLNRKEKGL